MFLYVGLPREDVDEADREVDHRRHRSDRIFLSVTIRAASADARNFWRTRSGGVCDRIGGDVHLSTASFFGAGYGEKRRIRKIPNFKRLISASTARPAGVSF